MLFALVKPLSSSHSTFNEEPTVAKRQRVGNHSLSTMVGFDLTKNDYIEPQVDFRDANIFGDLLDDELSASYDGLFSPHENSIDLDFQAALQDFDDFLIP